MSGVITLGALDVNEVSDFDVEGGDVGNMSSNWLWGDGQAFISIKENACHRLEWPDAITQSQLAKGKVCHPLHDLQHLSLGERC